MKKAIWLTLPALVAVLVLSGCGRGGGAGLATVNGESISAEDFHKYLETKESVTVLIPNSGPVELSVAGSLAFQALKDLVARKILMQLAKDEGVSPEEKDVLAELETRKKLNANYVKQETAGGKSIQRLKEEIAIGLAQERLLTKGITVSMDEVNKYIAKNKKSFMDPAQVDMQWIFVKTESARAAVDKELATGQPFVSVAQRLSEYPNARQEQGRFPPNRGQVTLVELLQPQLQDLVNKTAELKVTTWLKLQDGFAKFYVQKKTAAKAITMDAVRKGLVQRQLAQERGSQAVDLKKRISDKLKNSEIKIEDPSLKGPWEKAMDELKKASGTDVPKGSATPPAGG